MIMTSENHIVAGAAFATLLLVVPSVCGFSSTGQNAFVSRGSPYGNASGIHASLSPVSLFGLPRQRYDVGLGENAPVRSSKPEESRSSSVSCDCVQEATQYWMAPEQVVTYPSPVSSPKNEESPETVQQSKVSKKKKKRIPIHHCRKSQDIVIIIDDNAVVAHSTTTSDQMKTIQMDPNTVWVEMLIYEQQQQEQVT